MLNTRYFKNLFNKVLNESISFENAKNKLNVIKNDNLRANTSLTFKILPNLLVSFDKFKYISAGEEAVYFKLVKIKLLNLGITVLLMEGLKSG